MFGKDSLDAINQEILKLSMSGDLKISNKEIELSRRRIMLKL